LNPIRKAPTAELLIYLSGSESGIMKPALHITDPVWSGGMWGSIPGLELDRDNNPVIHSQNDAVGRNRWQKAVTVNYVDERFLVSGHSFSERDTLDPDFSFSCEYNLLSGAGKRKGKPFKASKTIQLLSDWSSEHLPAACHD